MSSLCQTLSQSLSPDCLGDVGKGTQRADEAWEKEETAPSYDEEDEKGYHQTKEHLQKGKTQNGTGDLSLQRKVPGITNNEVQTQPQASRNLFAVSISLEVVLVWKLQLETSEGIQNCQAKEALICHSLVSSAPLQIMVSSATERCS